MDTNDRDPNDHNAFLKFTYSDVICEPSGIRSPRWSHQYTTKIYEKTVIGTYWVLTIVFGGLLSILYGLMNGILTFLFVWIITPITVAWFIIPLGLLGKVWLVAMKSLIGPFFESFGMIFSKVNVNINRATIQNMV
ncbi:Caveolin-1 [Desmophyllum pertusum]|uniref:Caveolin n=1 Tax=Desmophyllum pertusum TaxID=174260 RepID=A0A9W9YA31_9CNID|nr:Caveolin-1 [Desmophyllum pertusum]